jgi:hypothetical protein
MVIRLYLFRNPEGAVRELEFAGSKSPYIPLYNVLQGLYLFFRQGILFSQTGFFSLLDFAFLCFLAGRGILRLRARPGGCAAKLHNPLAPLFYSL